MGAGRYVKASAAGCARKYSSPNKIWAAGVEGKTLQGLSRGRTSDDLRPLWSQAKNPALCRMSLVGGARGQVPPFSHCACICSVLTIPSSFQSYRFFLGLAPSCSSNNAFCRPFCLCRITFRLLAPAFYGLVGPRCSTQGQIPVASPIGPLLEPIKKKTNEKLT